MHSVIRALLFGGIALFFVGCSQFSDIENRSPTVALLRGEITPAEYENAITSANQRVLAEEEFERNKETTRAYNTRTGRVEFVPADTEQSWNEENQRWEFTPPAKDSKK